MGDKMPRMGRPLAPNPYNTPAKPSRTEAGVRDADFAPADALFTASQQRVLALLFGQPGRAFSISELIAESGAGSGATQRELARLSSSDLVSMRVDGSQRRYQANRYAPLYPELVAIAQKSLDIAPRLPLFTSRQPRKPSSRRKRT